MTLLNNRYPTILDVANMPGSENAKDVIDILAQFNPILEDAAAYPMNKGSYHLTTVRTGLPEPVWSRMYEGVPASKGTRQTVKDTGGVMKSAAEIDADLVDEFEKAEDKASIRMEEAEGHYEAMSQEAARALFYHDTKVDPSKPMGLAPRFSDRDAENGKQIVDFHREFSGADENLENTSVWMITWDKKASHLIYPKSSPAGLQRDDKGKTWSLDENGNKYDVYRENFKWNLGLTVRDWRYVTRLCNIVTGSMTIDASSGGNIIDALTEMYYRHYGRRTSIGQTFIYANTEVVKFLDYHARNAAGRNLFLTYDKTGPYAKEVLHFRGVPVRESDALINNEEQIAAPA